MTLIDQGALAGKAPVHHGRGKWPRGCHQFLRVGCAEWRGDVQGYSKILTDPGALVGKVPILLNR